MLEMPSEVAADPSQAKAWAQLVDERFTTRDVPALRLLCYWVSVADAAMDSLTGTHDHPSIIEPVAWSPFRTAEGKSIPVYRKKPAINILREATGQVQALCKQLGIAQHTGHEEAVPRPRTDKGELLRLVSGQ